jgi:uncharacterized protein YcfL
MKTVKKFYDKDGVEVAPEKATKCVELTINDKGRVVNTAVYVPKPE